MRTREAAIFWARPNPSRMLIWLKPLKIKKPGSKYLAKNLRKSVMLLWSGNTSGNKRTLSQSIEMNNSIRWTRNARWKCTLRRRTSSRTMTHLEKWIHSFNSNMEGKSRRLQWQRMRVKAQSSIKNSHSTTFKHKWKQVTHYNCKQWKRMRRVPII